MTFKWNRVADAIRERVALEAARNEDSQRLDDGQRGSLLWMAARIPKGGVLLADEVGTGKTRIACAVVHAVLRAGGRAAVVVPQGLMHQWKQESLELGVDTPEPRTATTLRLLIDSGEARPPKQTAPEWWLISHGFRVPQVRDESYWWRIALPSLVRCHLATEDQRRDKRTGIGKIVSELSEFKNKGWGGWRALDEIAATTARRIRSQRGLRSRLETLPLLGLEDQCDNSGVIESFRGGGASTCVTQELLGHWLGEFDLVVIDEAHKSRGEEPDEGTPRGTGENTVLGRLLNDILRQPEHGRRVCMTATPMELELEQWLGLLERARSSIDHVSGRSVVAQLDRAARAARIAPDDVGRIKHLCEASEAFRRVLSPHVTRRRREDDPLVADFREDETVKAVRASRPHSYPRPHRHLEQIPIGLNQLAGLSASWTEVLFAAECMSQSARGLSNKDTKEWPRVIRDAYTKLAAGHVSVDLLETDGGLRTPADAEPHTAARIARVGYWFAQLRAARLRVLASGTRPELSPNPDTEHPRIIAAVREIERWTTCSDPRMREKVLVFGVFLLPLRVLRHVLNVRHALRAADEGLPIARMTTSGPAMFALVRRQADLLRAEGALKGRLANATDAALRSALREAHSMYEKIRRNSERHARTIHNAWKAEPRRHARIGADNALADGLLRHLTAFFVDESMSGDLLDVRRAGKEFWNREVEPELSDANDDDSERSTNSALDRLRAVFCDADNLRMRTHAVLLHGESRMSTRRYVQAAFNRERSSPQVLIAQSQVGREGLNLQEACRVVVQFHAEWNPAVLEQQIGRVDRKGSRWEQLALRWRSGGRVGAPPFIEVRQLVFEGTYDAFQWDRVMRRQHIFDASLFGALLPADAWQRVPKDEWLALAKAAPSFRP